MPYPNYDISTKIGFNVPFYSYDVFDTVLTRLYFKPTDLFYLVARELNDKHLIKETDDMWVLYRTKAERQSLLGLSSEETTLENIYEYLSGTFNWSEAEKQQAMQIELDHEMNCLRSIAVSEQQIKTLRSKGFNITFLSDMYLPASLIRAALERAGLFKKEDKLFVSSEVGITKHSGNLYRKILEDYKIRAESFLHCGDNEFSDVKIPETLGIKATLMETTKATRYENELYNIGSGSSIFKSLLAGVSRTTRLSSVHDNPRLQTIWNVGSNVIGPLLFGYVYWILEEARRLGLKRLYFVARDGQILCRVAKIINQNWQYNIECRYLFGSRQSWCLPSLDVYRKADWEWIFAPTDFMSVRSVCERVNLQPVQMETLLNSFGFYSAEWDVNLRPFERTRLAQCFNHETITNLIAKASLEARKNVLGYFTQEGLLEKTPFGIIDIGWNGRLQRALSNMLNSVQGRPSDGVIGFYFGLCQHLKAFANDQMYAYFLDGERSCRRDFLGSYVSLYEIFCAADHGIVLGFQMQEDGKYYPVLKEANNTKALSWGLKVQQLAVVKFTEELSASCKRDEFSLEGIREASERVLTELLTKPSVDEADAYGAFEICEDQTDNKYHCLCDTITYSDLTKNLFLNKQIKYHGLWIEGSLVKSRLWIGGLFPKLLRLKQLVLKIRRRCICFLHR